MGPPYRFTTVDLASGTEPENKNSSGQGWQGGARCLRTLKAQALFPSLPLTPAIRKVTLFPSQAGTWKHSEAPVDSSEWEPWAWRGGLRLGKQATKGHCSWRAGWGRCPLRPGPGVGRFALEGKSSNPAHGGQHLTIVWLKIRNAGKCQRLFIFPWGGWGRKPLLFLG